MSHSGRIAALDGLRAVAILLVVGSHFVTQRIPGGFGVTLFFFISGFIITRVLLEDPRLGPFYVRRFFRLAPALFVLEVPLLPQGLVAALAATLISYFVVETPTRRLGARLADRLPAWSRTPG